MNISKFLLGTLVLTLFMIVPATAYIPTFSGDAEVDFPDVPGVLIIDDPGNPGGVPGEIPVVYPVAFGDANTYTSGWDIKDLRLAYDAGTDTMYVAVNSFGIVGDVDGNSDPSTRRYGAASPFTENADLCGGESVAVYFDLNMDPNDPGTFNNATDFDIIVGVSGATCIGGFTAAQWYLPAGFNPPSNFGTELPIKHIGPIPTNPRANDDPSGPWPDFEFTIPHWSEIPASLDAMVLGGFNDPNPTVFRVGAYMGSPTDGAIGEDYVHYEQVPSTIVTIESSALAVIDGGMVNLTVTEKNNTTYAIRGQQDGPNGPTIPVEVPFYDVQVAVDLNGAPFITLTASPDGGDDGNDVLNQGETWSWTIPNVLITDPTEFVATGSGADQLGLIHTFTEDPNMPGDPNEQAMVFVDVNEPNLAILKTVDCDNNGTYHSEETGPYGETGHWKIVVTNTGDSPITNIQVTDDLAPAGTFNPPFSLDPNESEEFNYDTPNMTATLTNTANAEGTDIFGGTVTAGPSTAINHILIPGLNVLKTVDCDNNGTYHSEETGTYGETGHWKIVVTNTGDVNITDIQVTDDLAPAGTFDPPFSLDPNESKEFNYDTPNMTVTLTNTANAEGTDVFGGTVTAGPSTAINYILTPDTMVDILANDSDGPIEVCEGEEVTLTICEQNTGDVNLTDVYVALSENGSPTGAILVYPPDIFAVGNTNDVLEPNEIWCWIGTVTVTTSTTYDATGHGLDPLGNDITTPTIPDHPLEYDDVVVNTIPCELGCRLTGGGVDEEYSDDGVSAQNDDNDRATFGGQAGANTALPPQPKGEWTHHQQKGPHGSFTFHAGTASSPAGSEIIEIRCSDPGGCTPSGDPPSPAKQVDFDGVGTFKNMGDRNRAPVWLPVPGGVTARCSSKGGKFRFDGTFHYFQVNADDNGEPGNQIKKLANTATCPSLGFGEKGAPGADLANCDCPDFYRITIYNGVNAADVDWIDDYNIDINSLDTTHVIYEFYGYIDGGNLQIHRLTGYDLNSAVYDPVNLNYLAANWLEGFKVE